MNLADLTISLDKKHLSHLADYLRKTGLRQFELHGHMAVIHQVYLHDNIFELSRYVDECRSNDTMENAAKFTKLMNLAAATFSAEHLYYLLLNNVLSRIAQQLPEWFATAENISLADLLAAMKPELERTEKIAVIQLPGSDYDKLPQRITNSALEIVTDTFQQVYYLNEGMIRQFFGAKMLAAAPAAIAETSSAIALHDGTDKERLKSAAVIEFFRRSFSLPAVLGAEGAKRDMETLLLTLQLSIIELGDGEVNTMIGAVTDTCAKAAENPTVTPETILSGVKYRLGASANYYAKLAEKQVQAFEKATGLAANYKGPLKGLS